MQARTDRRIGQRVSARGCRSRRRVLVIREKREQFARRSARLLELSVEINAQDESAVAPVFRRSLWLNVCRGNEFRSRLGPITRRTDPVISDLRKGGPELAVRRSI